MNNKTGFWVSIFFNVIAFITILSLWWRSDSSSLSEAHTSDLKTEYNQAIMNANKALLNQDYQEALSQYGYIDSVFDDNVTWKEKAASFIDYQNRLAKSTDSLKYLLGIRPSESILKEETLIKLDELQEQLVEKEHKIDTLYEKLDEATAAFSNTIKNNLMLRDKIQEVEGKFKVIDFDNEEHKSVRYYGEVEDGQANGFGIGIFESGGIYEGTWKNNTRHGRGKYTWKNEDVYEGGYVEGKREGYGVYIFASEIKYEGDWKGDLRHGKGKMYSPEGKILIEGEWQNDKFQKKKHKRKHKD